MIYLELFLTFFKIGAFTFGGGYAMLPLIQEEALSRGWLDAETLINFIAVSESTPGPLAVNLSTYIGWETAGFFGALCGTLGIAFPAFLIILIIAKGFEKFRKNFVVRGCLTGLRPAAVGLIGSAAISVGHTVFFPNGFSADKWMSANFLFSLGIFFAALFLLNKKTHPILIILGSAIVGILLF
ncbi:MAG: chromate transporter [Lachnospiraceae bacterium]